MTNTAILGKFNLVEIWAGNHPCSIAPARAFTNVYSRNPRESNRKDFHGEFNSKRFTSRFDCF